jgi:hypothetical protein
MLLGPVQSRSLTGVGTMSRRILPIATSVLLTLGICAVAYGAEPSMPPADASPPGITGPGLEMLAVTPGAVEVVAGAAVRMTSLGFGPATRILAIVGNGTDAPVDADVVWAASADGTLAWAGELGNSRSSINGVLLSGSVPGRIPPGGFGLRLGGDDGLPEDVAVSFAVRSETADEPARGEPAVAVTAASVSDGHLIGDLLNASEDAVERGIVVMAFCLDPSGVPTAGTGVFLDIDEPIEPGGTATFDIDLVGGDCPDFVVGALGDS